MAMMQRANVPVGEPVWARSQVPVEEFGQWVQAAMRADCLDKPGLYLLGDVLSAYSFEMGAAWPRGWMQQEMRAEKVVDVLHWGSSVAVDLRAALGAWDGVVYWIDR
jgi:hypothetical protein